MKIGKKSSLTRTRRQGRLRRRWPRQQTPESPHETSLGQPLLIWPEALSLQVQFFSSFLTFSPFGCATPPLNKSKKKKIKFSFLEKQTWDAAVYLIARWPRAGFPISLFFADSMEIKSFLDVERRRNRIFCALQTTFLKKPKRGDGYLCAGGRGRVFDPDARPSWKEGGGIVCVCRNAAPFPTRPLNHLTSREGSWSALSPLSVWFRLLLGDPSALPGGQPPPSFFFLSLKIFFFLPKKSRRRRRWLRRLLRWWVVDMEASRIFFYYYFYRKDPR